MKSTNAFFFQFIVMCIFYVLYFNAFKLFKFVNHLNSVQKLCLHFSGSVDSREVKDIDPNQFALIYLVKLVDFWPILNMPHKEQ